MNTQHFVMWWVSEGHRPTLEEGLAKLDHLKINGSSDEAFGWDRVDAVWRQKRCEMAAE